MDGNNVIASVRRRIPIMEGIRRDGLQLPRKEVLIWICSEDALVGLLTCVVV